MTVVKSVKVVKVAAVPAPVEAAEAVENSLDPGGCPKSDKRASRRHMLKALIGMSGWKKWKMLKMHPTQMAFNFAWKKMTKTISSLLPLPFNPWSKIHMRLVVSTKVFKRISSGCI